MKIYIIDWQLQHRVDFDLVDDGLARDWKLLIRDDVVFVTWDPSNGFRRLNEDENPSQMLLDPGVIILHGPSDALIGAINSETLRQPRLVAIQISGAPYDGEPSSFSWLYKVCTPVVDNDEGFSSRFKLFLEDLNKAGNLTPDNVRLLEPLTVPEPLLSYACAVHFSLPMLTELPEIIAKADYAYKTAHSFLKTLLAEGKDVNYPNVGLPNISEFSPLSYDKTSLRYRAICNAIDLLREDI